MKPTSKRFGEFLRPHHFSISSSVVLAIFGVGFGLTPYYLVYRLLMMLSDGMTIQHLTFYALAILVCFGLQILCHNISTAVSHKAAFHILEEIRMAILEKMLRMPLGDTKRMGSGHFQHMLLDGTERLEYPLAHAIPETTSNVLIPFGIIVLLFFADWRMALAVLIPTVATLLFYLPNYIQIMRNFEQTYYISLERMNGRIIEYIRGSKEIRVFGREKFAYKRFEESIEKYRSATLRLYNKMYFAAAPALIMLSSILTAVICVGGILYTYGVLSANIFLLSIFLATGIGGSLLKFSEFMDNFFHIRNGMRLVNELLSASEMQESVEEQQPKDNRIELNHVSFSYEDIPVLQDISMVLDEGEKIAIVGPSGAGKTTIANLLTRFWDVSEGSITIGGIDYRELQLPLLMERISYVTQDTFLFNKTIFENIRIGKPDASDAEIIEAAEKAQCAEFVTELKKGYHTVVGSGGSRLSVGQRQRVIIARAILKNAPILILDEATAYTDMENQHRIQASLRELCQDKTMIVVAHRLPTIQNCDKIIVLESGKISAIGTHMELLTTSDLYQRMWETHLEKTVGIRHREIEGYQC